MSEPFLAEIRMVGFNFAPQGWAFCDGQILPINQNQSLYSLLGTTYGGDGETTFALPDLRSRVPIHVGEGHQLGQKSGEETHTLAANEMPQHTHTARASGTNADTPIPTSNVLARNLDEPFVAPQQVFPKDDEVVATDEVVLRWQPVVSHMYASVSGVGKASLGAMRAGTITNVGGGQAHENMQPYLAVNFCIALQGLFPSPN